MDKVEVKSLVGQTGESLGSYVDYGVFCRVISEYEEKIEKMKCCNNCKHDRYGACVSPVRCENLERWELKDE